MRKFRNALCVLLAMVASLQLVSCMDSDNDGYTPPLTEEEYSLYLGSMSGMYTGKIYFWNDTIKTSGNNNNKTDSIMNSSAMVYGRGDSIIRVTMHPKYLVKTIKDNKELTDAINKMRTNVTIDSKFYLSYLQNGYVYFGVYPSKLTLPVTMNDGEHKVDFTFYNYVNLTGTYRNGAMSYDMLITKIELDGKKLKEFNVAYNQDDYYNAIYTVSMRK